MKIKKKGFFLDIDKSPEHVIDIARDKFEHNVEMSLCGKHYICFPPQETTVLPSPDECKYMSIFNIYLDYQDWAKLVLKELVKEKLDLSALMLLRQINANQHDLILKAFDSLLISMSEANYFKDQHVKVNQHTLLVLIIKTF